MVLYPHLKLRFDPASSQADSEVREVFSDDMARTLWMGVRQGHIVDQYFNR